MDTFKYAQASAYRAFNIFPRVLEIDRKLGSINVENNEGANIHIISHFYTVFELLRSSSIFTKTIELGFAAYCGFNLPNRDETKEDFAGSMKSIGAKLSNNWIEQRLILNNIIGQLHFDLELFRLRGIIDPEFVYEELIPLFADIIGSLSDENNKLIVDLPEYKRIIAITGYELALLICRHCDTDEYLSKTLKKAPALFVTNINKIRNEATEQLKTGNQVRKAVNFANKYGTTDQDGGNNAGYFRISPLDLERLRNYCDPNIKGNIGEEIIINTNRIANLEFSR